MPRGGRRAGAPGKAYTNRSDLNTQRTLPVQAGPSKQYGSRAAQERAQQQVPVATAPRPQPVMPQPAPGGPLPGSLGPLDAPTQRPNEPVTAGAALGPGPGPEVLPQIPEGIDPDLASLRKQLPMLELVASLPNASVATRNWVRRLRGIVPSEDI